MTQLTWNYSLRIGIGVFDKQHQGLVDTINELQDSVEAGSDHGVTGPLLEKLAADTRSHFSDEQDMMTSSRYPAAKLHALKHRNLLEKLDAFLARHGVGSVPLDQHSLNFLRDWVSTHIQSDDLNFGLWLNEHGKR
ncbi:MAG: bacteriohemerythrin [Terracidiphilus sp.]|nr:bacteriohemerythrin [Terracidiphilus sp.]